MKSRHMLVCFRFFSKDPVEEARMQAAIDSYFEAGNIVPSPWVNSVRKGKLRRTPGQ